MNKPLRILHLEDEPDFAELVKSLFAQDGLEADVQGANDRASFENLLATREFDVIVSDYHLPKFTGLEALALAKQKFPHIPFILVSGTIGEQAAIESLRAGATDYVLKQKPDRLPSAVRRAVKEAEERAKLREAEFESARRERYFRALTENLLDVVAILNREGVYTYISPSVEHMHGFKPEELVGQSAFEQMHPEDVPKVQKSFKALLKTPGKSAKVEYRYKQKDGAWHYHEAYVQNRLDDPEIKGIVASCRDVTDRWRAQEELRDSERQYRLLFQSNPNPMWVFDLESQAFLEVNEAAIQTYGYSREEFLAMTIADIRPPEKNGHRKTIVPDNAGRGLIWRHVCKDGSFIDAEVIWSPMVFRQHFAALTMAVDVTERRQAEHRNSAFSKLSHRLGSVTTASEAAMIICEAADTLFRWSDFALDLYDTARDQVHSLLNITTVEGQRTEIPPSPQPKTANALIRRVIEKGAELLTAKEAGEFAAATMLAPITKGDRVIGVLLIQNHRPGSYSQSDLEMLQTLADQCSGALERVRAEQGLRESQQRFRDLFENSPDAIFVEDLDGMVLDANFTACVLHGMTRDQLIGKSAIDDLVPPHRRETARTDFQKLADGKLSWVEGESLTVGGRTVPVEVRAGRIEYDGKPALLLHVRDITERRASLAAVESSEALFRSVWENSVDGMRLTDESGIVVAVNDSYCKLMGMEAAMLEGKPFTVTYATSENWDEMLNNLREFFAARSSERQRQRQHTLHDGRVVHLEITDSFIEIQGRPLLMLSLFRDVTLHRRLEEQLLQSQKMEAIGQLAGGVAHDFNNILTVIHGHASLLSMSDLDDTGARSAQQITQAAERAAGLTRQLLTFSRRQLIQPKRFDMNKLVGNMTDMLGRILGEDVALQLNYCQSPAIVEADAGMMEQVLLNLAVNARDAMPRGGKLSVRIAIVDVNELHVQHHAEARVGQFVCVSKGDTGCGIPQENLSRIFEPFFTTKDVGKGTGLGLATVYGIVRQHQGWVEVDSAVGKGTTFRIYVPRVGDEKVESEKPTTQIIVRGGDEGILLVEDEKPVRDLVARVLQKQGYKVFQAGNGDEAVELWKQHADEVSLLLTDLVMPGSLNGRELAEKFWNERPELKVIFTSGYSADIVGKDFKLEPEVNFLQKPYHPQTLALTVRRCLDRKPK
ncbi:MAG TPA: PAS domain S-box protein [Methylomirabilota bacterium]|nr:PAS domain S-box protein [Methylomirabilota bacterium]